MFDSPASRNTQLHFTGFVAANHTLTQLSTRLGAACRSIQEVSILDMAQKQQLVEVRADFEQIINKVIDQCSRQAYLKFKGQHFEHLLFIISSIVCIGEMFYATLIITVKTEKTLLSNLCGRPAHTVLQ